VFRYCTTDMRSFFKMASARGRFSIADENFRRAALLLL
jgi:hypothetical protein